LTVREQTEKIEQTVLSPLAALSKNSKGRNSFEEHCPIRTIYQRDCDRIIHCKSFRRLKHKTQVFLAPEGDHYRTRLTHTLEVAQVARTIARALRLNEDLTYAIALGHDLGHTPFGHAGERLLDSVHPKGFKHYEQSLRVVERLERDGKGLNLSHEVKDGILCHTKGKEASTLEGRIVRIADKIAYINHDIDDAVRAKLLQSCDIPSEITDVLGTSLTKRINTLVTSVVENSKDNIMMDDKTQKSFNSLHKFMFDNVYVTSLAKAEEGKAQELLKQLYEYFVKEQTLPPEYDYIIEHEGIDRAVCDYIANMSDVYAMYIYKELFIPKSWGVL